MEQGVSVVKDVLLHYGPLGIGWLVAAALLWPIFRKTDTTKSLADAYHESIMANTKVLERLATLIDERTRRR